MHTGQWSAHFTVYILNFFIFLFCKTGAEGGGFKHNLVPQSLYKSGLILVRTGRIWRTFCRTRRPSKSGGCGTLTASGRRQPSPSTPTRTSSRPVYYINPYLKHRQPLGGGRPPPSHLPEPVPDQFIYKSFSGTWTASGRRPPSPSTPTRTSSRPVYFINMCCESISGTFSWIHPPSHLPVPGQCRINQCCEFRFQICLNCQEKSIGFFLLFPNMFKIIGVRSGT